jgi:hypothetical protein
VLVVHRQARRAVAGRQRNAADELGGPRVQHGHLVAVLDVEPDLAVRAGLRELRLAVTASARPSLMKPRPRSDAIAMPCTPGVSAMVPITWSVRVSMTSVAVACET